MNAARPLAGGRDSGYDKPRRFSVGLRPDLDNMGTAWFCSASPKSMR